MNRPLRKMGLERIVPGGTGFGANRPVGGKDCYIPRDSVGAEDSDSCGYIQGGKDWYMPKDIVGCHMPDDSVGAEDGYS